MTNLKNSYLIDVIVDQHRRDRTQELQRIEDCDTDASCGIIIIPGSDLNLIEQECAELRAKGEQDGWKSIAPIV